MKPIRDPEGAELGHLVAACELDGKVVLEIGCGDGKFTRQYAGMPARLVGIDPELNDLRVAKKRKIRPKPHLFFSQAKGEKLPFPAGSFDIAILASSL